jgi:hypothetical protein
MLKIGVCIKRDIGTDRPTVNMTSELGYRGNHNAVTYLTVYIGSSTTDRTNKCWYICVCVCESVCARVQVRPGGSVAGQQARRVGNEDVRGRCVRTV